jgi:hypothetical protein
MPTLLREMTSYVFMIKKVNINVGPIRSGYGVMDVFCLKRPPVNRASQVALRCNRNSQRKLRLATRAVHNRAAA